MFEGANESEGFTELNKSKLEPGLYVVSTPIGNLADITYRAVNTLKRVDLIAAEDTRHSRPLLQYYGITTNTTSYHEHNEAKESQRLVGLIQSGQAIAIISDAGTPLLSDPGSKLVKACTDAGIKVFPVPGASALLSAVVAAQFNCSRFTYLGFLDRKGKDRKDDLKLIIESTVPTVLYESPNRLKSTLEDFIELGEGDREILVGRELTKYYETFYRGSISSVLGQLPDNVRGEVVIVVSGRVEQELSAVDLTSVAREMFLSGATSRDIVSRLTAEFSAPRNVAYRIAQSLKDDSPKS